MGSCNFLKVFLALLNVTFLALGAAVIALAAWGVKHIDSFKGVLTGGTVRTAEAAGALLVIVSLFGLLGAIMANHKFGRFLLITYNVVLFVLAGLTLAGAGLVIVFAKDINKSQLNQAKSAVQTWVNNLYDTQCCPGGVLSKSCPIYDWVSQSDCASKDAFFTAIKSFVKKHFGAIAGILFGAAALQIITCCISCHVIRKGRAEQKKEEAAAAPGAKQAVQTVYYAPPVVSQPMANPYNSQPQVAADHRF